MIVLVAVETVVLVVLCVLVAGLLRGYAEVLRRLHRLDGAGSAVDRRREDDAAEAAPFATAGEVVAPAVQRAGSVHRVAGRDEWSAGHDISGVTLDGEIVHVRTVGVAHDTLLAFLSSGCSGCAGFWRELARPGGWTPAGGVRLVVVAKGPDDESPRRLEELCAPGVDVVLSSRAWSDYRVPGSPYVVVVDGRTGRVKGEGSGSSFAQLGALLDQASADRQSRAVRKPAADAMREADVDRVLHEAGIWPGHPSLYQPLHAPSRLGAGEAAHDDKR